MPRKAIRLNMPLVRRIVKLIDYGLTWGKGRQEPGEMCVEAVVCAAMGLPHRDDPPCVGRLVREFKIVVNDNPRWSSKIARGAGLRDLAIAQLGSDKIDQNLFAERLGVETIRQIVPRALRKESNLIIDALGWMQDYLGDDDEDKSKFDNRVARLEEAAKGCETAPSIAQAIKAEQIARECCRQHSHLANLANLTPVVWCCERAEEALRLRSPYWAAFAARWAAELVTTEERDGELAFAAQVCVGVLRQLACPGVALLDKLRAEEERRKA